MPALDYKISPQVARRIALLSQGLHGAVNFSWNAEGASRLLEHLSYVQIDTISVVERAHHHIFWARIPTYRANDLHSLMGQGRAFEYWSHAASYIPMRDFRFSLPKKKEYLQGKKHWFVPTPEHAKWRRRILARIKAEGPLPTRAFEGASTGEGGWGGAKPSKQALGQLFMEGNLMVSGRQGFAKLYDLSERVIPESVNTTYPKPAEVARHLIESAIRAHGFARAEEIFYLRSREMKQAGTKEIARMKQEGLLVGMSVEGVKEPYLVSPESWGSLVHSADSFRGITRILSPFDGLLIQRKRLAELFNFDYLIECYVPEAKRKFGYFVLPILDGDRLIGRLDAKAFRKEKRLEVRSLHAEAKVKPAALRESIRGALTDFGVFNGCTEIVLPR
jgi:uncharacterized protein YcaQ